MANSTTAAVAASKLGYRPVPIRSNDKRPPLGSWTALQIPDDELVERFTAWAEDGSANIGLILGIPSGGLIDVDLDHPKTRRLKEHFLPPTPMRSGRAGRPDSHYWYQVDGAVPSTRQYLMPTIDGKRGAVIVELRSTGSQTVIPPSIHPTGESYRWSGKPFGGAEGPSHHDGRKLIVQVASLALGVVLLDHWPTRGSRHEAYLALAGGLLRSPVGVHPFWERNLPALISALAEATLDDDGPDVRVREVMGTTLARLRAADRNTTGLPRLGEIIGEEHVRRIRELIAEIEQAAGYQSRQAPLVSPDLRDEPSEHDELYDEAAALPAENNDPLEQREATWQPVYLMPYLTGDVQTISPTVLKRDDGQPLLYAGRTNMLAGSSESAKSWIALKACGQEMAEGARVVYIDFEDEPILTIERLRLLGVGSDTIRDQFIYIRPEEPHALLQRSRWGDPNPTERGQFNRALFEKALEDADPTLIVADGMTVLYRLHGLDTNATGDTDVISSFLKTLTRNGRSTVIVIDHTPKNSQKGALPVGSQHKESMIQGTMLQAWPKTQPAPGRIGEIELIVLKDRPGKVRASAPGDKKIQTIAIVTMDSRQPGHTKMTIAPPPDPLVTAQQGHVDLSGNRDAERAQKFRDQEDNIKAVYGGEIDRMLSKTEIMRATSYGRDAVEKAIARLVHQGWLYQDGRGNQIKYGLSVGDAKYSDSDAAPPPDAPDAADPGPVQTP